MSIFPAGNRKSWRGRGGVFLFVPTTTQVRLKWNTQRRLDECCQNVLAVSLHDVTKESRDNVSRVCNNEVLLLCLRNITN